jgi:hypothetical protein
MNSKLLTAAVAVVALILGVAIGTSGGSEKSAAKAAPKKSDDVTTVASTSTPTPTATPDNDADDDGATDEHDAAPDDPEVQTKADKQGCHYKGITRKEGKEGTCVDDEDGTKLKVVNRSTPLVLKQMTVRLNSITHTDTITAEYSDPQVGSFVVADVSITNNLDGPVEVDATDMFALSLGKKVFTPDSDVMIEANSTDDNIIYDEVQAGGVAHGKVVFRVPARVASKLSVDGNLVATQFSDADGYSEAEHRVGVIRTYT